MKTFLSRVSALLLVVSAQSAFAAVQFFTNETMFRAAAGSLAVVNFDSHTNGPIVGDEWCAAGVTFSQPDGGALELLTDNVQFTPNSKPLALWWSSGSPSERIKLELFPPRLALGFWMIDSERTSGAESVDFFDVLGRPLRSERMRSCDCVTQSTNANFFYGLISDTPIGSAIVQESPSDNESVGIDTVLIGRRPVDTRFEVRVSQVELCWDTVSNVTYQLQFRETFGADRWSSLGSPVLGDGRRYCTNDAVLRGQPQKFYRVSAEGSPMSTATMMIDFDDVDASLSNSILLPPDFYKSLGARFSRPIPVANICRFEPNFCQAFPNAGGTAPNALPLTSVVHSDLCIEVTFVLPSTMTWATVDWVSARFIDGNVNTSIGMLQAFDISGTLLASTSATTPQTFGRTLEVRGANIARVRFCSDADGGYIDNVSFSAPTNVAAPLMSIRVSELEFCWDTVSNVAYQLFFRETLDNDCWMPLGGVVHGDGTRFCTKEVVPRGQPRRQYILSAVASP